MTQSCWTPFWAGCLSFFLVAYHMHCFVFTHGLLCPFVFSFWASTARLLILLGFLSLFANSTLPWALLLTSLGFPSSITLSLSLGLWACHKSLTLLVYTTLGLQRPFLTFLTHTLPMGCYFFLSWLLWARLPFSRPMYTFVGPMTHYSYRLGLMVLFAIYTVNSLWPSLLGFSICWASTNGPQQPSNVRKK